MYKLLYDGTTKYNRKISKHLKLMGNTLMDFICSEDGDNALF